MKKILLSLVVIAATMTSFAQMPFVLSGTNYTQSFDNLGSGLPMGWRVDTLVNKNAGLGNDAQVRYSSNTVTWTSTSRGFKNVASADGLTSASSSADQNNSSDRALAVRQVGSNAGWDDLDSLVSFNFGISNTAGLTGFNLQFKIQSLHTAATRYNNWIVQYGFGSNPSSFTTMATSPAVLVLDSNFSNTSVTVNFGAALNNQSQPVWIRIMAGDTSSGSGSRPLVAIDDFNLSWTGSAAGDPKPLIASLNPQDNATGVAITTVPAITFDKNISSGTGNVYIRNLTDATTQTLPVGSIGVAGMTATLTGTTLLNGKNYAIQFDSTCFTASGNNSYGIYDSTTWNFTTVPATNPAQTSLNETFTGCNAPTFGLFTEFSVNGTQTWRCSNFGRNDTDAVYMNGFAGGSSNDNEDWLISPAMNLSAMTNPYLHFWSKRRFNGNNTKEVFVSNNYTGTGDPNAVGWTNLNVNFSSLDTTYIPFYNNNLTSYKASNFHFAFKYVSAASGTADEWSIDDVYVTDGPVSVRDLSAIDLQFAVVGQVSESLQMIFNAEFAQELNVEILSTSGQVLSKSMIQIAAGKNTRQMDVSSLANGVYMVRVGKGQQTAVAKFTKN
jgi:hypothetical protein